jgi:hypothetical protein
MSENDAKVSLFNEGDVVRITKKSVPFASFHWNSHMDKTIGTTGVVVRQVVGHGVDTFLVELDGGYASWTYGADSLELRYKSVWWG